MEDAVEFLERDRLGQVVVHARFEAALAIAGHGVVLAYSTIAEADIAAGRLVRLFSLALPDLFSYYIVTAPGALERPKVRAFRDWLRHEADTTPA